MKRHMFYPARQRTVVIVVVVLAGACGRVHGASAPTVTKAPLPPASTATTSANIATTTSGARTSAVVAVSEDDNGRSVTVHRGDAVTVVLHSTYWSMLSPSNPTAVVPQGSPTTAPQVQHCVPGQGCGTVTAYYKALSAGQSQLAAHRETCGEALLCSPDQKDWRITVTVSL